MISYIFLFIIIITGIISFDFVQKKQTKKMVVIFIIGFIILFQGLRSFDVGRDLQNYMRNYYSLESFSIIDLFKYNDSEYLYFLVGKFFNFLNLDFRIMLFFTSFMTYGLLGIMSYKYSKNPVMSIFIFITLGLFVFSLSGLRQSIAIGISLIAFHYIKNKKFIKYLILIIIAALFHESAIFTLPIYFLYNAKKRSNLQLASIPIFIIVFIFRQEITTYITHLYNPDHNIIETGARNMMLLFIIIYIASMYVTKITDNDFVYRLQRILFAAILVQMMATYSQTVSRLGYYYYSYLILLIPELISLIKEKEYKFALQSAFIVVFTLLFFNNIITSPLDTYPYKFLSIVNNQYKFLRIVVSLNFK